MEAVADEFREKKRYNNLLLVASTRGYTADVKTLIQRGAEVNIGDNRKLTALHFAAGRGWLDIVQFLWSKAADIDAESSLGLTPLHLAALNGREDIVLFLLSKNALINVEDAEENTPLHSAARGGQLGVVTLILDAVSSAATCVRAKNKLGLTPGACALLHGHIDIANKLVAQGWDPQQPGPEQFSLLHLTAAVGRSEAVSWLLENGAGDVDDAANADKLTPLHCAAISGDIYTCQVLLDARADVDAVDAKNHRPIDLLPLASSSSPNINSDATKATSVPVEVVEELRDLLKPSMESNSASRAATKSSPPQATSDGTKTSSASSSRHAAFLSLSPADQIRRARQWTSLHPTELHEALETYPGAQEAIRRVNMAIEVKRTAEILKAMSSLRCDEEFQKDIAQPSVYQAVMSLRKDPSLYDGLAQDLKVKSVVAKMGRVHAAVQANGQRTFVIEELIVPVVEMEICERQDKKRIELALHALECQLAAAAAAAAASSKEQAVAAAAEAEKEMKIGEKKKKEKIVEDKKQSKEAAWKQEERKASIFDDAIANAKGDEDGEREERRWRMLMFLAVVVLLWSMSLMYRWGMFRTEYGEPEIDIKIDYQ